MSPARLRTLKNVLRKLGSGSKVVGKGLYRGAKDTVQAGKYLGQNPAARKPAAYAATLGAGLGLYTGIKVHRRANEAAQSVLYPRKGTF